MCLLSATIIPRYSLALFDIYCCMVQLLVSPGLFE